MQQGAETSLKRNFLTLADPSKQARKKALESLLKLFNSPQFSRKDDPFFARQLLTQNYRTLLKLFADEGDVIRQQAVELVRILLEKSNEIADFMPYVFSILVQRLNCHDLEGVLSLPQVMRPPPGQKPKVVIKLVERVEEVRLKLSELVASIIKFSDQQLLKSSIDSLVDMLRALAMDPLTDIQKSACDNIGLLCKQLGQTLLNFTQPLARAILLPLVSKKSKIRLAALDALSQVLDCGVWKKNAFVMEILVGYRDPNSIAIKDFFQPSINFNYLATLIADTNDSVRVGFMKCLHRWVCELADKYDHHPRLLPYLLAGLIDSNQECRKIAFRTFEDIGMQIQVQKEKQFREQKQYGVDAWWTGDQKLERRPSLGARYFVRGHIRKMMTALQRELRDLSQTNRARAANLTLLGIIYSQQYIVQYLDTLIPQLIGSLAGWPPSVQKPIRECFYHIGRYCNYSAYSHILLSALQNMYVADDVFLKGTLLASSQIIRGSKFDPGFFDLTAKVCEQITSSNAEEAFRLVNFLIAAILKVEYQPDQKQQGVIRHILGLVFYQQYIVKSIIINLPFSEEDGQPIVKAGRQSQWAKCVNNLTKIVKLYPPWEKCQFQLSFGSPQWKQFCSYWVFFNCMQPCNDPLCIEPFIKNIRLAQLPDSADFLLKLSLAFAKKQVKGLVRLSIEAARFLAQFQPVKPKTAIEQLDATNNKKLPYKLVVGMLSIMLKAVNLMHKEGYLMMQDIAEVTSSTIQLCKSRFKREPEAIGLVVKLHWAILERKGFIYKAEQCKAGDEYVTPAWIDFALSVIEQAGQKTEPQVVLMAFQILKQLLLSFPRVVGLTTPLPMHYVDYPELLDKLFKYTLAQKNLELRERYQGLLAVLCDKIREWFLLQQRQAKERKMYERRGLIEAVLQRVS